MKTQLIIAIFLLFPAFPLHADLQMMKALKVNSKTGPAFSNILGNPQVEMREAEVDIRVDLPNQSDGMAVISTNAIFKMRNASEDKLNITVGFPISDSMYSACKVTNFEAKSNDKVRWSWESAMPGAEIQEFKARSGGEQHSVFHRITGYPRYRVHTWISGPNRDEAILPDAAQEPNLTGENGAWGRESKKEIKAPMTAETLSQAIKKMVAQKPKPSKAERRVEEGGRNGWCNNVMVWGETFTPGEERTIEVNYRFTVPPQEKKSELREVVSNQKGIWKEEANNCPDAFLQRLKEGSNYYFFDYFLTTGASWHGPIGKEIIRLHLPTGYSEADLACSKNDALRSVDGALQYTLENEEPSENLYFALPAN